MDKVLIVVGVVFFAVSCVMTFGVFDFKGQCLESMTIRGDASSVACALYEFTRDVR